MHYLYRFLTLLCNVCNKIIYITYFYIYLSFSSFNALGECCQERLSDFNITIGDSTKENGDANPVCVSNVGLPTGQDTWKFKCSSKATGRYLYIKTNLKDALTLCEVKVFGELT